MINMHSAHYGLDVKDVELREGLFWPKVAL